MPSQKPTTSSACPRPPFYLSEGGLKLTNNNSEKIHEDSSAKNDPKDAPPSAPKDIYSSKKHSMDYVTVDGIKKRTGYDHEKDWYLLCLKEFLDNGVDFLWNKYQGASDAAIDVYIEKTSNSWLIIKVRNTNPSNFTAFNNLEQIFNFDMTFGSKQNLHIISRGVLGDAMKQILALGYVLIHTKDDGTTFTDDQWEIPLIIRSNKVEYQVFLQVDIANQIINASPINQKPIESSHTDTEIELTLPITIESRIDLDIHVLEQFCKEYPIFTTDISFKFKLVDNSPEPPKEKVSYDTETKKFTTEFIETLTAPARKAAIKIEFPALHPIAKEWKNKGSIHSYKQGEFKTFIENVHDKANTSVYDRIQQLREGSNLKMSPDNEMSIAELIADPNKGKKLEKLFWQLRAVLSAPNKLSLPYTTNSEQRKDSLVKRIARLHDGKLAIKKAVYKTVDGFYKDDIVSYPYVFEIIAIPYTDESIDNNEDWVTTTFKGSVNYSISPRGNIFEGDYEWNDPKKTTVFTKPTANNVPEILGVYNFHFYKCSNAKAKLPCVIYANLVTPRVDYHGADKSRIDIQPFAETIVKACRKMSDGIQTFKAAGFEFYTKNTRSFTPVREKKKTIEDIMTELLKGWM
jgi:hypothetical protein